MFHDHVMNTCAYSIQSYALSIHPENNSIMDFMTNKRMYIWVLPSEKIECSDEATLSKRSQVHLGPDRS